MKITRFCCNYNKTLFLFCSKCPIAMTSLFKKHFGFFEDLGPNSECCWIRVSDPFSRNFVCHHRFQKAIFASFNRKISIIQYGNFARGPYVKYPYCWTFWYLKIRCFQATIFFFFIFVSNRNDVIIVTTVLRISKPLNIELV